jgi:hypothetical protein
MTRRRERALLGLLEMIREAELARLAENTRRCEALRARIDRMRGASSPTEAAGEGTKAALAWEGSGAAERWERWKTAELARLNAELARLMAEREALIQAASRAVGRASAFEQMIRPRP